MAAPDSDPIALAPWPLASPALEELLAALRDTHVNGGALFARFRAGSWPLLRDRAETTAFLEGFLTSAAVRAALPELQVGDTLAVRPAFEADSAFTLEGELARTLSVGGAYVRFAAGPGEARALARRACEAIVGDRFDEVYVHHSSLPWAPWFHDVAWDATWVGMDPLERTIWLLCVTDTD
jgi:hypothetical protein